MTISHFSGKFFFGIMLCLGLSVTDAVAQDYYEDHKKGDPYRFEEPDGFVWYKDVKNGAVQVYDKDMNVLIPRSRGYKSCTFRESSGMFSLGRFYTSADGENVTLYIGLAKKDGTEVIRWENHYTSGYRTKKGNRYVVKKDDFVGVCDSTGRELISPDLGYTSCTATHGCYKVGNKKYVGLHDYETGKVMIPLSRRYTNFSFNTVRNYIPVRRGSLKGACLMDGTEVVPPVWYDCVYNDKTGCFMVRRSADTLWEKTGITIQE